MVDDILKKIQMLEKENKDLNQRVKHLESILNVKKEPVENAVDVNTLIQERLKLFKSYFKGREDVYAIKHITKDNKKLYFPVIKNEFKQWNESKRKYEILRPKGVNIYEPYTLDVLKKHLSKFELDFSIGIYPLLDDDTCYFVAIDFDKEYWKEDLKIVIDVASENDIPFLIERSQSGNGAHLWFFFEDKTSGYKARRMATILLNLSMKESKSLTLDSYDRLFPSQDTLSKDGIGNLIALPLDAKSRKNMNSIFLDSALDPIDNDEQWDHLSQTKKIQTQQLEHFLSRFNKDFEYVASNTGDTIQNTVTIIKEEGLKILLEDLNSTTLHNLRMIASFKNPEFFKKQKMRFSTWDTPRMICAAYRDSEYIYLPRNCLDEVVEHFNSQSIEYEMVNNQTTNTPIDAQFNGKLKPAQKEAMKQIETVKSGIISAPTGFGKTVLGANIISKRKLNTLIIVPSKTLLYQWRDALERFLNIDFEIGLLGDGKNTLSNKIDIDIVNSLEKHKEIISNYSSILVDECHHAASLRYENILRKVKSPYIYGLSATPIRNDGLQKLIFMYIGDIIYSLSHKDDNKSKQFKGKVFPILTHYETQYTKFDMHKIYEYISSDLDRNKIIIEKTLENYKEYRSILILSNRIDHLYEIATLLDDKKTDYILITGSLSTTPRKEMLEKMNHAKENEKSLIILSTGQYIGEGFDFPALDTLILASPIAWKGSLIQYVGRVNREHKNKNEVRVYDLLDFKVPVLSRMYDKRLRAYRQIGYEIVTQSKENSIQTLYNAKDFKKKFEHDVKNAQKSIIISAPQISNKNLDHMLTLISNNKNDLDVKIVTNTEKNPHIDDQFMLFLITEIDLISTNTDQISFVLIDDDIIWYGSINPMYHYHKDDSILRLYQSNYYDEFLNLIETEAPQYF